MKLTRVFLSAVFLFLGGTSFAQTVSVVDLPAVGVSRNYQSFRSPLKPARLLKLPVGSIKPQGWVGEMLHRQANGLNGHLWEISAWLDKENNQWLSGKGDHGWEEVPYWLRGYCSLAYILNDDAMKREAQTWFEGVLKSQRPDGFFGPENKSNGRVEVWAQMVMLWALQTYYEQSHDARVLTLMKNYFNWELAQSDTSFLKAYWENKRGGDNEWTVVWYYNQTGDATVLPLIDKIHRNLANWTQATTLPDWHGVNIAECFREPALYYLQKGDSSLIRAAYNNFRIVRDLYGQVPGGMYGADENCRKGYSDPRQGTETCAFVEQMASDEILMGITGDAFWADHCENVAFNSLPAAMTEDLRALRYFTAPNMAIANGGPHSPFMQNGGPAHLSMTGLSSRCCQHDHGMGWPYYAEHMVMATNDNGLAAMLYGSSTTTAKVGNGKTIRLIETSNYPFEEGVKFVVSTKGSVKFPLYLRIPAWSDSTFVKVNGKAVKADLQLGKYLKIDRKWKNGDQVEISMPMRLTPKVWAANKQSVSLNYGPLTFSLKIKTKTVKRNGTDRDVKFGGAKWQKTLDTSKWPSYEYYADGPWNYSLLVDKQYMPVDFEIVHKPWPASNFPFAPEDTPIELKAKGRLVPSWGFDEAQNNKTTETLPDVDTPLDKKVSDLTLIPMGAARLRISAFPNHTN